TGGNFFAGSSETFEIGENDSDVFMILRIDGTLLLQLGSNFCGQDIQQQGLSKLLLLLDFALLLQDGLMGQCEPLPQTRDYADHQHKGASQPNGESVNQRSLRLHIHQQEANRSTCKTGDCERIPEEYFRFSDGLNANLQGAPADKTDYSCQEEKRTGQADA